MNKKEKEKELRAHADLYIVCFHEECPLQARCLRRLVAQYADPSRYIRDCVNPAYEHAADGKCAIYVSNEPMVLPLGMRNFYHDMPGWMEKKIKGTLIAHYGRTNYYKYHSARLPIPPKEQQYIEKVCRNAGWQSPLTYDATTETFLW